MGPDQVGQILNFPTSTHRSDGHPPVRRPSDGDDPVTASPGPLDEVDRIFEGRVQGLSHGSERQARIDTENIRLRQEFSALCASTVRPAMESFLERVRVHGGGGLIEERSGVEHAGVSPRIRLWMSLSGELIGRPRRDQHPYLQLDLDVERQEVTLEAGDMWKGHGSSGPVGVWIASEITGAMVTQSLVDVLRRAAS
ncbi:MAG TPA: hypothetical protein VII76_14440 [Acidimicrobiales bacterium]